MVAAHRPLRLLSLLALAIIVASPVLADSTEDMTVARSRMNASAEKVRRTNVRLTDELKTQRRELLAEAQGLHDEAKSLSPSDEGGAARLSQEMDATRDQLDALLATMGEAATGAAPSAGTSADGAQMESSGPAAIPEPIPEEPAKPAPPNVQVARYRDIARQAVDIRERLTPTEYGRVRELILSGDVVAADIEANPHEDHVARAAAVADLAGITEELHDIHVLGLTDRRKGIPFVEARSTAAGWTQVGLVQGPFAILRARFLKPGSAYVTVRNTSDVAHPFAVSLDFVDVSGQPTGNASFASQPDANLRAGEVREVLLGIAPSVERFWGLTTDFTVSVQ